jgi:hypothetical protein
MRNLSAAELLTAWERALGQSPVRQALVLLAAAYPEHSPEQLAQFSIGQRDACLLTLRERLFGSQLTSVTACPQCQQRIELAFNVPDVRVEPVATNAVDPTGEAITLTMKGYQVHFRLPNSLDLIAIETSTNVEQAREQLLRRCLQSVVCEGADSDDGEPLDDVSRLPMALADTIVERMAQADPQADTRLALSCPDCGHEWRATFDIAIYLAGEIHGWAKHILREIHGLARAYGWREADILAMTPTRRRAYLELLDLG